MRPLTFPWGHQATPPCKTCLTRSCGALIGWTFISLATRGTYMEQNTNKNTAMGQAERPEAQSEGEETVRTSGPQTQSESRVPVQQAREPQAQGTSRRGNQEVKSGVPQGHKGTIRVNSVEDVDLMTDEEIHFARISGTSKKRLQDRIKAGQGYHEAKRAVIKDNLIRFQKAQNRPKQAKEAKLDPSTKPGPSKGKGMEKQGPQRTQKRPRPEASTPPSIQMRKKKARMDEMSMSEALSAVKVAIAPEGFPEVMMATDRLNATQDAIMEAYERIPGDGPQVRFAKCTHRPGYVLVVCADATSAEWLREITPTLQPWEGASLKTLEGSEIPGLHACTVYVPDENGRRLEAERILTRLRVGNRGLNTSLWTVFGKTPAEKGQLWTLSMDKQSMEELKKLDMRPYFGMGRIKFRPKEQGQKPARQEGEDERAQEPPEETQPPPDTRPKKGKMAEGTKKKGRQTREEGATQGTSSASQSGLSPLKRCTAQKRTTPMEVEEVSGGDQPEETPSLQ